LNEHITTPLFAVIGGSGLYEIDGLEDIQEHKLDTPFGKPSAPIISGVLNGHRVAFLSRHGDGHKINPSAVNYRANIYALKMLGVQKVISVNACGSLREDYQPGDIVVPDQIYDHTKNREYTFFDQGITAHVSTADPFCSELSKSLVQALQKTGASIHAQGGFVIIEGPRFSTRLESNTFRSWGMSIIGMTTAPEAFLAREAELCYASLAHITDYDAWHTGEDPVSVNMVLGILEKNLDTVKKTLTALVEILAPETAACECESALEGTIITHPEAVNPAVKKKFELILSKYL
jgi:5'-methylthioadenosine phosphorylase